MRDKKEHFSINAFEADVNAEFANWTNEEQQTEYLKNIATQIGLIIIEFNRLEWQLNEVLKQYFCNDIPEVSAIYFDIIASDKFASKVDLLKKFYKLYANGDKKHIFDESEDLKNWSEKVSKLIDQLKKCSQMRNKYAHSFWHLLDEHKFVEFKSEINNEQGLNKVFLRFNEQDLQDDFELIDEAQIELYNLDSLFNETYTNT